MVAIAKTIINDIFADDGIELNQCNISSWLDIRWKRYTDKQLEQTLTQMVECKILTFEQTTQEYRRVA